jgi:hypothetical protein
LERLAKINTGMTAVRAIHSWYLKYMMQDSRSVHTPKAIMSFQEDIDILVGEMKSHFGANVMEISRDSQGFNQWSALPISQAATGTQRFLEHWSSAQEWVDTMIGSKDAGHLFMEQPELDDEEEVMVDPDEAESAIEEDLSAAAALGGSEEDAWVKNAVLQWDTTHKDKEGVMDDDGKAQARVLLTRSARRVKVLCQRRYTVRQQQLLAAEEEAKKKARREAAVAGAEAEGRLVEYDVQAIRGKKLHPVHKLVYKVQWKGCSRLEDTWEPVANLSNAKDKIAEFEQRSERWHRSHGTFKSTDKHPDADLESESDPEDNAPLGSLLL